MITPEGEPVKESVGSRAPDRAWARSLPQERSGSKSWHRYDKRSRDVTVSSVTLGSVSRWSIYPLSPIILLIHENMTGAPIFVDATSSRPSIDDQSWAVSEGGKRGEQLRPARLVDIAALLS